ncbi:MAG: polysaccharide deacetylase family protein [Verrucomicrobia bacterium]|nr:polysaccharide deacetylase family protein [Verrucomicrobiota bacterium]
MSIHSTVKTLGYRTILPMLRAAARKQELAIGISYHRFQPVGTDDPKPGMAVRRDTFIRHVEWLREIGTIVSIDDVASGDGKGLRFFLSFDDGYADNATVLLPLVAKHEIPCCVYVVTNFVKGEIPVLEHDKKAGFKSAAMSIGQLRDIARNPLITVGSHTMNHVRLSDVDEPERLQEELSGSRRWLAETLGEDVRHFAVPWGQPSDLVFEDTAKCLLEAGYETFVTNFGGVNSSAKPEVLREEGKHLLHLRRAPAPLTDDRDIFLGWVLGIANLHERYLPRTYMGNG